jgi:mono/diheme cytochrome c family protein
MRLISSIMLTSVATLAHAQSLPQEPRGELLYRTHCVGCHTTQVHWREKTLATDWASLAAQVERWQKNAQLGWSDEDVDAVARYLNAAYYRFPPPEGKPVANVRPSLRIARRG